MIILYRLFPLLQGPLVPKSCWAFSSVFCYNEAMIFNDSALVLLRQDFRETDRIVAIYTYEHGRLNARLPGVSRSTGKLKALCEPLTLSDLRIYVKRGGVIGTVTGGKVRSVFPHIIDVAADSASSTQPGKIHAFSLCANRTRSGVSLSGDCPRIYFALNDFGRFWVRSSCVTYFPYFLATHA